MRRRRINAKITVHPGVIGVLGEQLVSDAPRAIAELVKNAYDADSERVDIKLIDGPAGRRQLIIADNGHGMTLRAIREGWLQIATPQKRRHAESPRGRVMTGSMGIGRLAAFSLASTVTIDTGTGRTGWYRIRLRTSAFARATSLSRVNIPIVPIEPPDDLQGKAVERGTIIRLTQLHWWPRKDSDVDNLRQRLALIQGPAETSAFKLVLAVGEKEFALEPEQELSTAPYTITGVVDDDGLPNSKSKPPPLAV